MADQEKVDRPEGGLSELLSPSELFAARSRSHKLPVRGQKEFYPSGSEQQTRRLKNSLAEHWELVSEERVERLGNLVKGVWNPSDQIVELQSPAGKFWQTMGFSANGKQCLQPEEALYLMECGNLQVFHRDLPLSIQDGYEMFLSSSDLSLHEYQVFGHLKRLGYVVNRFDASSSPSTYERQLNLPPPRDRGANQLKRKRSPSPEATPTVTTSPPRAAEKQEDPTNRSSAQDQAINRTPPSPQSPRPPTDDDVTGRRWWGGGGLPAEQRQEVGRLPSPSGSAPRWDFLSIRFPDLGEPDATLLASPDPSLLPGAMAAVGVCSVSPWLGRLNLRKEKAGRSSGGGREDREAQGCSSWAAYRTLMERRRSEEEEEEEQSRRNGDRRTAHLWEGDVTPLHDPREATPMAELLQKISVVKTCRWADAASSVQAEGEWRISFNVHQPAANTEFRKSSPGTPYSCMCVCSFDGLVPGLGALQHLSRQSGGVPVTMAVVDHGDISFYTFKHFLLPLDLPQ